MIGGGDGAFVGAVHRIASQIDNPIKRRQSLGNLSRI